MTVPAGVSTPAETPAAPAAPQSVESLIAARLSALAPEAAVPAPPVPSPAPTDASASIPVSTAPDGADGLTEPAPSDAPVAADAVEGAPEGQPATEETQVAAESIVVQIPAKRPGEAAFDLPVQTEEQAERVRQLVNGYMRKSELQEQKRVVDETRAQLRAAEAMIEADPVGFLTSKMPAEVKLQVARALLAENYEALKGDVEAWYEDTGARKLFAAEAKEQSIAAQQQFERARTHQEQAAAVQSAVSALIPEGAADADVQDFYGDALTHLSRLAESGQRVTPSTVAEQLSRHLTRYGFTVPVAPVSARTAAPAPVATPPVSRPAAVAAPVVRTVPASVLAQRQNAAATVPPGPGAAPASMPRPPKGLNLDQTLAWFEQQAKLRAAV